MSDATGPVLIFGKNGQVGSALVSRLGNRPNVISLSREDADFTQPSQASEAIRSLKPSVILNAAAYTAVDAAETDRETAFRVNAEAPSAIAMEAEKCGATVIHFSTDYVFSGDAAKPYGEEDRTGPVNVYGESKLAGEQATLDTCTRHIVLRTSWVYAAEGKNFLNAIRRLAVSENRLSVVVDQTGSPTWAGAIANATIKILDQLSSQECWGLYHLSAAGQTTWADFAHAICEKCAEPPPEIERITTEEYGLPAERPRYTVLDNRKLKKAFGIQMPDWQEQLDQCLTE